MSVCDRIKPSCGFGFTPNDLNRIFTLLGLTEFFTWKSHGQIERCCVWPSRHCGPPLISEPFGCPHGHGFVNSEADVHNYLTWIHTMYNPAAIKLWVNKDVRV